MNRLHLVALALLAGSLGACAHSIHDVYLSGVTPGTDLHGGTAISSETTQRVILGFADETAYVDAARNELMAQCPKGALEGVTTQFSTDLGFLSWTNRIKMKATCLNKTKILSSAGIL